MNVLHAHIPPHTHGDQGKRVTAIYWGSSGRNDSVDVGIGYDSVGGTIDQAAGWSRFGEPPYAPFRRLAAAGAKLELDPRSAYGSEVSSSHESGRDRGARAPDVHCAKDIAGHPRSTMRQTTRENWISICP